MALDVVTPGSPGWWLARCHQKLIARQPRLRRLFARYEGNPWEPDWLATAPDAAKRFYRASRTSFATMIVKAPLHRLRVTSIATADGGGDLGDTDAWRVWRAAGMLSEAPEVCRTLLIAGDGYVILGVDDTGPYATSEDPRQVVTIHDPIRQSRVRAAAKFFTDTDTGVDYGYLYLPGRRFVARSPEGAAPALGVTDAARTRAAFAPSTWVWDETAGGSDGEAFPAGMDDFVGVVRFRNDEGVGEFERHEDILYRLDHVILQGMVIATMQAFRQRAIKVDPQDMPDVDPFTGEAINYDEVLSADPGALWKLPLTAELWESGQVDLNGILQMAEKEMQRLSAVTFTPLSMFNSDAVNQSAAGAELVKEGLTDKVSALQERLEQPYAMVASGLLRLSGFTDRAGLDGIKVGWSPAVRYTLNERAQAAMAGKTSEVPWRTRMLEFWQFSPEQIAQAESERMSDALLFPAAVAAAGGSEAPTTSGADPAGAVADGGAGG